HRRGRWTSSGWCRLWRMRPRRATLSSCMHALTIPQALIPHKINGKDWHSSFCGRSCLLSSTRLTKASRPAMWTLMHGQSVSSRRHFSAVLVLLLPWFITLVPP
ncbi:hypothetical protein HBH89_254390, partial [Parastagonospora nodorum]